jgi:hypothetical protein
MQLWRFFKKPSIDADDVPTVLTITDRYPLYAITCDKKLAKRFQRERNSDKFIIKKTKVDKAEYAEYAMRNRSCVLCIQKLTTVKNKNTKDQEILDVEVLLTTAEYQICKEPMILIGDDSWWTNTAYEVPNPYIFNTEVTKALRYFDYIMLYKLFVESAEMMEQDDDYSVPQWYIDELAYFVDIYQDTFR